MSLNQINDVHYSVITGILVITICKSMNKENPHCSLDTSVCVHRLFLQMLMLILQLMPWIQPAMLWDQQCNN